MRPFPDFVPQGVIPATLLALDQDLAIDEKASRNSSPCMKPSGDGPWLAYLDETALSGVGEPIQRECAGAVGKEVRSPTLSVRAR